MSNTRQNRIREELLLSCPNIPEDKLRLALSTIANYRGRIESISAVKYVRYNEDTDCVLFSIESFVRRGKLVRTSIEKNLGTGLSNIWVFVNSELYTTLSCTDDIEIGRRVSDIVSKIQAIPRYTDSEVLEILKKVSVANSLAKMNQENKSFLYGVKHGFVKYVVLCHPGLLEYLKPVVLESDLSRKMLEVKIQDQVFHVPYDKQKARYGFIWGPDTKPSVYKKEDPQPLPEDLDTKKLEYDLVNIYIKISGGKPGKMKPGAVKFWWTREILRKKYNNPSLELIRSNGDSMSDYSAQDGVKYKMINGDTTAEKSFFEYFMEALKSGIKL